MRLRCCWWFSFAFNGDSGWNCVWISKWITANVENFPSLALNTTHTHSIHINHTQNIRILYTYSTHNIRLLPTYNIPMLTQCPVPPALTCCSLSSSFRWSAINFTPSMALSISGWYIILWGLFHTLSDLFTPLPLTTPTVIAKYILSLTECSFYIRYNLCNGTFSGRLLLTKAVNNISVCISLTLLADSTPLCAASILCILLLLYCSMLLVYCTNLRLFDSKCGNVLLIRAVEWLTKLILTLTLMSPIESLIIFIIINVRSQ